MSKPFRGSSLLFTGFVDFPGVARSIKDLHGYVHPRRRCAKPLRIRGLV